MARAPGGLGFVQDVINTMSADRPRKPDLLGDLDRAQSWLDGALEQWSALTGAPTDPIVLQERDVESLRDLRADLHSVLANRGDTERVAPALHPATLGARMEPDGAVSLEPRGEGWRRVSAIVVLQAFVAQQQDTWRRLKVCGNRRCGVAFYDRSRNSSAVWHDARACANAINLRASRERRRKLPSAASARDES